MPANVVAAPPCRSALRMFAGFARATGTVMRARFLLGAPRQAVCLLRAA